jgi:hypothetical protein
MSERTKTQLMTPCALFGRLKCRLTTNEQFPLNASVLLSE